MYRLFGLFSRFERQREFSCSDCERRERCGSLPRDDCIVKAAQLERGDWKLRQHARALRHTVAPMGY